MRVPSISASLEGKMRLLIVSLVTAWLGILCDWTSTVHYTKIPSTYEMHPAYSPVSAFLLFSIVIPLACFASPREGGWKFWPIGLAAFAWLGYIYNEIHFSGLLFLAVMILGACGLPLGLVYLFYRRYRSKKSIDKGVWYGDEVPRCGSCYEKVFTCENCALHPALLFPFKLLVTGPKNTGPVVALDTWVLKRES